MIFPICFSPVPFYIPVSPREIRRFFCGLFQSYWFSLLFPGSLDPDSQEDTVFLLASLSDTNIYELLLCAALGPTNTLTNNMDIANILKELMLQWWELITHMGK